MAVATLPRKEHLLGQSQHVKQERHLLAHRLIAFRSEHNIARRVVASLIGCSQSNIKCIECEESDPSFALLKTIEKMLALKPHTVRRLMKTRGIKP